MTDPVAWATVQQAIVTWALAASELPVGQVVWAGQDGPQTARPYLTLQLITGVVEQAPPENRHESQVMIELIKVLAAASQTYEVAVDDVAYQYAATVPPDDIEAIRDALLVDLGALANITAAAVETDQIRLTGSATRPHFHTATLPADSISTTTEADAISTTTYQPGTLTLRVTCHTDTIAPAGHARAYVHRCLGSLGRRTERALLTAAGIVPLQTLAQQDMTSIVGAETESQYFADILLGGSLESAEDTSWFRTVEVSGTVGG